MATTMSQSGLLATELRAHMSGEVIAAGDGGFEEARKVWNGCIDRRPALIARCRDTSDVVATVNFARDRELTLAVRGGGHSVVGFSTCDGGVVLDLSAMRLVNVDKESQVARAEAGCTWRDYDAITQAHGLASPGGIMSTTGIAGLTLGGGIGWLSRKYGLACDSVLATEIVTATGETLRVSAAENAELFWGIRGGGGNFGVVTRFEFALQPVGTITGGLVLFPWDRLAEVSSFYREYTSGLTDDFTTMLIGMTAPPVEWVPEALQMQPAVAIVGCHCGDPESAGVALALIRELGPAVDIFGPMPYTELQQMVDADLPAGRRYYFKGGFVSALSDEVVATIDDFMARRPSPVNELDLHHMGGAIARVGDNDTAFTDRSSPFMYNVIAIWDDPAEDGANQAWSREFAAALNSFGTGEQYVNFLGDAAPASQVQAAYGANRYARLQELKRRYDLGNLFHLNQNIRP
jgi:FAD binding domain/Berberine and berberine like